MKKHVYMEKTTHKQLIIPYVTITMNSLIKLTCD